MADLVTATEYKTYAGISGSGDDTVIGVLIDIACAQIRRYCGRNMTTGFDAAVTYTEKYDGNGYKQLQLTEWPITSITSVAEIDEAGTSTTLDATEYRVNLTNGILERLGARTGRFATNSFGEVDGPGWGWEPCWTEGLQNFTVVYVSAGIATDDLKFAVYQLIDWMYAERRRNPMMQSESLGAYSYTRMAMSDDPQAALVRSVCKPFRTGGV